MTRLCIIGAILCAAALAALPVWAGEPTTLTLHIAAPGKAAIEIVAGIMNGPDFCAATGRLIAADIAASNPGLQVTYACVPFGEAV